MNVVPFLLLRLATALLTLLGVAALVFAALRLIPGTPADVLLGPMATPEMRAILTARYGLDQSLPQQFGHWLAALARGDFGISMVTNEPVMNELARRAPYTGELASLTMLVALATGVPLGVWSALSTRGRGVVVGRLVGAVGASVPEFVLGSFLIYAFSNWQLGLQVGGFVPFGEDAGANLRSLALPTLSMSVFGMALILRTTREAVLRVMTEGHITAAVGRGETPWFIVRHHVLRNAAIPLVTVVTTYFGFLLGGALIAEVLFSIPGLGYYLYNALEGRDYAVVQAGVLLAAVVFIGLNMLADVAYALVDPRIGATKART